MTRLTRWTILMLAFTLFAMVFAPRVQAQTSTGTVNVTIGVSATGAKFKVDGREYTTRATFIWPIGSKHVLDFPQNDDGFQYNDIRDTRFQFTAWQDSKNGLIASARQLVITADTGVQFIEAGVGTFYKLTLVLHQGRPINLGSAECKPGTNPPPDELRPGVVFIGAICYWDNTETWIVGHTQVNAFPYPGFVFLGWNATGLGPNNLGFDPNSALGVYQPLSASTLVARFTSAKRVNFRTDPMGLAVRVDRSEVPTPNVDPCEPNNYEIPFAPKGILPLCRGDFDFLPGSPHVIGAPSPQVDRTGKVWVFESFSNGQGQNSVYTTPQEVYPSERLVAKFQRGVSAQFLTKPTGLRISISNRDNWYNNYFVYLPGQKVTIDAPAEQVDSKGRKYVFKRWSDGGDRSHEITVPNTPDESLAVTAEYELLSQIQISTNQPGSVILVDGVECALPCKVDRASGTEVRLSAPANRTISEDHRVEFVGWGDTADRERVVTASGEAPAALTARFQAAFKLTIATDPPNAAVFSVTPESPDGFYPADAFLYISITGKPGYRFRRWELDLDGTGRTSTLVMARPRTVLARMDKVPFISDAGIRNAAAGTSDGTVAPGSLVSIFGANLSDSFEAGPSGPILSQALAGVSVLVGDRILPLLFVSPDQINAQLPRDLAPGEYQLRVIRVGQPDVLGKFTVSANAPGLFSARVDEQDYATAFHEDGTPVSMESPARRGELVSIIGTGFGAYQLNAPEGFVLPPAPAYKSMDPVALVTGELEREPAFAGGAAGQVGVDVVRFRIGEDLGSGPMIPLQVKVAEKLSNRVILPIE